MQNPKTMTDKELRDFYDDLVRITGGLSTVSEEINHREITARLDYIGQLLEKLLDKS